MITWWNGLQLIQQIFAVMAIPATLILIIQTILLLLGAGSDHDVSTHAGSVHDIGAHDVGTPDIGLHDAGAHDFDAQAGVGHAVGLHGEAPPETAAGTDTHPVETTAGYHDTGLRLFTLQGIVAFFAIGGWAGIALIDLGLMPLLAGVLALIAGALSLLLVAWLLGQMLKLQSAGNIDIGNAIGLTGEVSLRIPGGLKGYGKGTVIVQESSLEIDAVTDDAAGIETGAQIKVVARRGDRLLVRRLT